MDNLFRTLRADEIECRIGQNGNNWCTLLLYKDARVDMDMLDEKVGPYNWKREHSRDNANCIVSIYDKDKHEWVSKEDVGSESNTEKEKGLASDSFKRACVNWGIGRELYTAPQIWISLYDTEVEVGKDGKVRLKIFKGHFVVDSIEYDGNRNIKELTIKDKYGNIRFSTSKGVKVAKPATSQPAPTTQTAAQTIDTKAVVEQFFKTNIKAAEYYLGKFNCGTLDEFNNRHWADIYAELKRNNKI